MSHISKIFEEAPIKVQNRNGFDLSHTRAGTSKTGQLVPCLTKLLPPNSTISLGVNMEVSLPPLAAQFYGRVDAIVEGFVVPCSILYGGWKQFISAGESTQVASYSGYGSHSIDGSNDREDNYSNVLLNDALYSNNSYQLPVFDLTTITAAGTGSTWNNLLSTHDNVYEFLGFKGLTSSGIADVEEFEVSLLPALAYHKICDTFYRNTKLTKTWFAVNPNGSSTIPSNAKNVSLIWHSYYTNSDRVFSGASLTFTDGTSIFSTRQRTYTRDYFTSAAASPQQGGQSTLQFLVEDGISGSFTINALRMANSLQKFLETNNLSGDYAEMMRNRWGVRPIDADFDEPHYLGRVVVPVYQHTVYQTAQGANGTTESSNPFQADGTLGATAGSGTFNGEGSICDNFNVSCWSYVMCLFSLVPHANYSYGLNRELTMTKLGDFPAPELQGVGMEEIFNYELYCAPDGSEFNGTFGYIPRYSRFKYMDDEVVGELAPGKSLQAFQLQRQFSDVPQLGTQFVTIPQNALDGVFAVNSSTMNLSCWYEIYFKFHVVMPLADFCIPTLGELQDTHTINTRVGGARL